MAFKLSVPSKTFILGEYVALMGGPTLLVATDKNFELLVQFTGPTRLTGVHLKSPAGLYYLKHKEYFKGLEIEFIDPYNGAGGLGASSAQFVMLHALQSMLANRFTIAQSKLTPEQVWRDYRGIFPESDGWLPSGADVVSQLVGGITSFQWKNFKVEKLQWDFQDLNFMVFKTGHKVSTHEHLNQLKQVDIVELEHISQTTTLALKQGDAFQFVKGLTQYHEQLMSQNLVCKPTIELLKNLKHTDQVISAKGCGALGADTIFVVCEKPNIESLKALSRVVGLSFVASSELISTGLKFDFKYEYNRPHSLSTARDNEVCL